MNPIPLYFAPLQGYTIAPYRNLHAAVCGGVAGYYASFVRVEHGEVRRRDMRDIDPECNSILPLPQVIAATPEELRFICLKVKELGYSLIDINMGCPFPMQTRYGRGVDLMQHPDHTALLMEEVKRLQEEEDLEFSVKIRFGQESADEWEEILPILDQAHLQHITVHARTGKQMYKGGADVDMFRRMYEQSSTPLIYNGDLASVEDIQRIADQFPCLKGIMLGRGLISRPTLAHEYVTGETCSLEDVCQKHLQIHSGVLDIFCRTLEGGETQILQKTLPYWDYADFYFDHRFIKALHKAHNLAEYKSILASY